MAVHPLLSIIAVFCAAVFSSISMAGELKLTGIDEVIFQEEQVLLISYGSWTCQKWNSAELLRAQQDTALEKEWQPLVRPTSEFVPRQVVGGESRNLLILDAVNRKIWQLDSLMQVLSSMNIPTELSTEKLMETRMFRSERQRYTFINVREGKVWQFQEFSGKLNPVFQVNIPLSIRQCFIAQGYGKNLDFKNHPFWCVSEKKIRAYNSFFSSSKMISLDEMTGKESGQIQLTPGIPVIRVTEEKKSVLEYHLQGISVCFTPQSREFSYCAAE